MAASQREALKLFRNIARGHNAQLPPVLSSALTQQVKQRFLLSFSEFSKVTKPQEKQAFEESFFSKWNSYLATVRERDYRKDYENIMKVILDKTGKETLPPSPLPPYLRPVVSALSPDKQEEIQQIRLEIAQKQTEAVRQTWNEAEPELIKDLTPAELEEYYAAKNQPPRTLKPEELKKATEQLVSTVNDMVNNEQYLKFFLPLHKPKRSAPTSQDTLLTPDQLKQSAKKIEELQKLTAEQRKEKLKQLSSQSLLPPEQQKRVEELFFYRKTLEEKKEIEEKLRGLSPQERASAIESLLASEYFPLSARVNLRKLEAQKAQWTPEQREQDLKNQEIEAIQNLEQAAQNRAEYLKIIETVRKAVDPKGEHQAQFDRLSEEEKSEQTIRAADILFPKAWNEFISQKLSDPILLRAQKSNPKQVQEWYDRQFDPAKLKEENEQLLKAISESSQASSSTKH